MIPADFELSKILPIIISIIALSVSILSFFWNVNIEFYKRKSNIEVWQRNKFFVGGEDERTEINLIMRNLSPRPSAILAILVRDEKGGIIKNLEGTDNINFPIKIESWGVEKVTFRITPEDEARVDSNIKCTIARFAEHLTWRPVAETLPWSVVESIHRQF